MLSMSFSPYDFLVCSTQKSAFSQSAQRQFLLDFWSRHAAIFEAQDSKKYFFTEKGCKLSFFSHILWTKGLGVERITFDRIFLHWKVSVGDPEVASWDLADLLSLENCTLCRKGSCSSVTLRKSRLPHISPAWEWPCLLRTMFRAVGQSWVNPP